jgi:hypothetical protein
MLGWYLNIVYRRFLAPIHVAGSSLKIWCRNVSSSWIPKFQYRVHKIPALNLLLVYYFIRSPQLFVIFRNMFISDS